MTRVVFREETLRTTKRGTCGRCAKAHTRSKTFSQTVNPWNRRPDGVPKSPAEVRASLVAEADAWRREPIEPCSFHVMKR